MVNPVSTPHIKSYPVAVAQSSHAAPRCVVLAQPLPPRPQADQGGETRGGNAHGKHHFEPGHVPVDDVGLLFRGEGVADVGRARQDERRHVDLGRDALDVEDHLVDKGRLGGRDEECTAEALEDCGGVIVS